MAKRMSCVTTMLVIPKLKLEALDEIADAARHDGIDHGGGLVVEDRLRLGGQRTGDGDAALLAGGEARRQEVTVSLAPTRSSSRLTSC
jgi:hypothetical protein